MKIKGFFITATAITIITGCSTIKYSNLKTETAVDSVFVERLVKYIVPDDSTTIEAVLKCDSMGQVYIKRINMLESRNMSLNFMLDSMGNMKQKVYHKTDTIYIPQIHTETRIRQNSEISEEKEKRVGIQWNIYIIAVQSCIIAALICIILISKRGYL